MAEQLLENIRIGDQVTVRMPSGTILPGGEIASIQVELGTCKVHWPDTGSHFLVPLVDLLPPF
jgi:hypothetical protein